MEGFALQLFISQGKAHVEACTLPQPEPAEACLLFGDAQTARGGQQVARQVREQA